MSKALLIKSYTNITTGTPGQWNDLNMADSYIQGIETGKILEGLTADKLGALISGVPTPWARAKLFKFALQTLATPDPNIGASGLQQFYELLYGEWKGLIAVIALFPDRIHFSKPVTMNVKGGDYDIAAAFGRMLFDEKDIWSNQDKLDKDPDSQPYIHLIYYRDKLVGGTSPTTGVFTGVDYSGLGGDASDINWYRNGKFEDPTRFFSPDQRQKVYLFVKNMNGNLDAFEKKINSQRGGKQTIDLGGLKLMSRKWEDELRKEGGDTLRDKGPIAKYGTLECPFSVLFKSDVPVYLKPDFTFTYTNDADYQLIGDIQDLLSDDKYVIGWAEDKDERSNKLSDGPIFFLKVKDLQGGSMYYFSLPLSERGVDVFKNSLSGLLGYTAGGNTLLVASITDAGQLAVTLIVEIDGEKVTLNTREYEIDWMTDPGRVIMWPNFVSEKWNKYYLYSEFTADAKERFTPIFKLQGEFVKNAGNEFLTADYVPSPTENKVVDVKQLVTYPAGQGEDLPKYNIISADKPFAGLSATVKDTGKDVHAGFLLLRPQVIEDRTTFDIKGTAVVGIDFGSNNTCVYYNEGDKGAMPVQFGNYRSVLVGKENCDMNAIAENNELLFFTNYPSDNGQVKSWLHEHDSRYISHHESEEIAGGVPVNRPNVLVREMDQYEIKTQAGILHYNMKWLDNDKGLQKKRAFLKSIWLNVCAFLYKNKIRPEEIQWSFPGAMMEADRADLEKIFEELCKITPIRIGRLPQLSEQLTTEAEAVCSFALSQDFGLNRDNMFLGIDVGGSTSDILLLAKDPNNSNSSSLYRESSVRLAAGVFFNAVIKSENFRQALVSFHEGKRTNVYVENIHEILSQPQKAPYYLNSIFDQLRSEEDYEEFYSSIYANARFVFTIPAYVTGLLLFYSGMLVGKVIKTEHMEHINRIDILSFGKGGRLFHWLRNAAGKRATKEYYSNCLNAGVNLIIDKDMEVKYRDEIEVDNKAEVAKGLVDPKTLIKKTQNSDSDICGETGVKYTMPDGKPKLLYTEDELTGDYFANEMNNFDFSDVENFEKFMNIFIEFVSQKTRLYPKADDALRDELADLPNRITGYICNNDNEYKKARKNAGNGFHYHQPIIIAEGLSFLDTLIKKAFNQ